MSHFHTDPDLLCAIREFREERARLSDIIRDNAARAIPLVVEEALSDVSLPHAARLAMWHLRRRLTMTEFTEVTGLSLGAEMRVKERTVRDQLQVLVGRGYLEVRPLDRQTRAYRFPASRTAQQFRRAA